VDAECDKLAKVVGRTKLKIVLTDRREKKEQKSANFKVWGEVLEESTLYFCKYSNSFKNNAGQAEGSLCTKSQHDPFRPFR